MFRIILYSIFCFFLMFTGVKAQFKWIEVGVNGLTCSQCSRSTELSIKKLDFVKEVQMDLERTQGKITFKPGSDISVEKIAKAVEDAGFSVRYLKADFDFSQVVVKDGSCFSFQNRSYQFVKPETKPLNGEMQIKFLGKDFLPKKEYKEWEQELKPKCAETKERVFYVTLI